MTEIKYPIKVDMPLNKETKSSLYLEIRLGLFNKIIFLEARIRIDNKCTMGMSSPSNIETVFQKALLFLQREKKLKTKK